MIAFKVHDDTDAELARLRRDLMSFVINEINRGTRADGVHPLAAPIADAIAEQAGSATRSELLLLGNSLADVVVDALEPHLSTRVPALIQPAVEAAMTAYKVEHPEPVPPWMLWALLGTNILSLLLVAALVILK